MYQFYNMSFPESIKLLSISKDRRGASPAILEKLALSEWIYFSPGGVNFWKVIK